MWKPRSRRWPPSFDRTNHRTSSTKQHRPFQWDHLSTLSSLDAMTVVPTARRGAPQVESRNSPRLMQAPPRNGRPHPRSCSNRFRRCDIPYAVSYYRRTVIQPGENGSLFGKQTNCAVRNFLIPYRPDTDWNLLFHDFLRTFFVRVTFLAKIVLAVIVMDGNS